VDTDVETIRTMGTVRYFAINLVQLKTNLFYLLEGERYSGFLLAGIFTAIVLGIRRAKDEIRWVILAIMLIMSLCTYMVSGGDPSEGFITATPLCMLASIFVAFALYNLTNGFQISLRIGFQQLVVERQFSQKTAVSLLVMAFVVAAIILPIFRTLYNVTLTGTGAAYRVADYFDNHAEPDSIIETWERELLVLSDLTFHVPPQSTLAKLQEDKVNDPDSSGQIYDFRDHVEPQYVVIGAFARWAGVYDDTLDGYVQAAIYDQYTIFERVEE
jgi:hypothetical protein